MAIHPGGVSRPQTPPKPSAAGSVGRGGAAEGTSFAACGTASDPQLAPTSLRRAPFSMMRKGRKNQQGRDFDFPPLHPSLKTTNQGGLRAPLLDVPPRAGGCVIPRGSFQRWGNRSSPSLAVFKGWGVGAGEIRNPPPRPFLSRRFLLERKRCRRRHGPPKLRKKDAVKTHSVLLGYRDYSPTTAAQRGHSSV